MATALDPNGCFEHVLERERGQPGATTWLLHFLQGKELDVIRAQADADKLQSIEEVDMVLRMALRGWRGFKDAAGAEVTFPPVEDADVFGHRLPAASTAAMARLPLTAPDRLELLGAILGGNQVTGDAAKKSSSPQP